MRIYINPEGELHIYPETQLDCYALKMWCSVNKNKGTDNIIFHTEKDDISKKLNDLPMGQLIDGVCRKKR